MNHRRPLSGPRCRIFGDHPCVLPEKSIYEFNGIEGAYAAVTIGDRDIGAPERAAAFPSNTWEYVNARRDRGSTYFVPITEKMIGREIDVHVLGYDEDHTDLPPFVWLIPASASPSGEMRTPGPTPVEISGGTLHPKRARYTTLGAR